MKKTGIFRRLLASAVAMSMIMTIGTAVFGDSIGTLNLGQARTMSNNNVSNVTDYYTYTPSFTASFTLSGRRTSGTSNGTVQVSTSPDFNTTVASLTNLGSNNKTTTFTLNANTPYYFRAGRQTGGNSSVTVSFTLTGNFDTTAITFNSNGGSGTMNSISVPRNHESTLPQCTFTRNNYVFAGWATSNNGPVVYTDGGSITPTTATVTLYAKWAQRTTINFNAGGGQGQMSSITVPRGYESTLPLCTFTRSGYEFAGWATSNQSSAPVTYADGGSITPTQYQSTVTLYAKWNQIYTVSFDKASQYATGTVNPMTGTAGTTIILPTEGFTRNNYELIGWSTSADATTAEYGLGAEYTISGNKTLYAVWSKTVFDINFLKNADDATGTVNPMSGASGDVINLPDSGFSRTGYELAGWDTSSTATTPTYALGAEYTISGNEDLYAVWNQIYTVSFDKNDGSGTTITPMTGTAGTTITLPSSGYTRWGYELIGWAESKSSTATILPLGSTYTITGNKTLYAVWGQVLSFNANNGTGSINPILARRNSYIVLPGLNAGISREGYTLVGWGTSSTSTNYRDPESTYQMPNSNRTLYAIWQGTLSFSANGGSGSINSRALVIGATTSLPSAGVTRTGYGLRGWDTSATATVPSHRGGTDYTFNGNTTLYAVWGPQLSYNGNGGTGSIQTMTYDTNTEVTLSSNTGYQKFTKDGYTILGWARSADATAPEFGLGGTLTITEPTTLYAVWGRNLAFAPNGGTGEIPSILAVPGTTITLPETGFTRDGYTLAGWSIASDGTTKDYELGAEYTVTDGNVTLTAVWECTLSFDANGGTGDAMDDLTVIAGATVNLPACTYEYTTYSFAGWADTTTGTPASTYTPTASTTLYAIWTERDVYQVIFDANGGEGTMSPLNLTDDVTGTIPACEFTYTGFTFLGWTTDPASTTVEYVEGDPIVVVDSDITLYALWSARDVYYVNFDANGGEGTMSPLALTDDVTGTIPACGFTRDGYTCIGWAVDADSETVDYVQGDSIRLTNDNLTLYAVWEEGVTPGPEPGPEPEPEEPVYTPEQLREMNITHFVDNLYLVALGRPYDDEGRDHWVNQLLVDGNSSSDIVYGFLNSQEFISKNLSNEEYITLLYRIFFDREPDAEGMANWMNKLANNATRNDILRGFAASEEWLTYCARYQVNP